MNSCEFVTYISALACAITKNRSADEINLLAAVFTQLGDTLATISVREEICSPKESDDDVSKKNP